MLWWQRLDTLACNSSPCYPRGPRKLCNQNVASNAPVSLQLLDTEGRVSHCICWFTMYLSHLNIRYLIEFFFVCHSCLISNSLNISFQVDCLTGLQCSCRGSSCCAVWIQIILSKRLICLYRNCCAPSLCSLCLSANMEPLTYSWIGQCAAAPLVFLLSAWCLGVFHSYRRHWLSVDLFLLALSAEELLMSLQAFVYALLSLIKPGWDGACGTLVWSLNSTRALQLATVASLLADRALTCHWPYRYRFSVRRHQLRYHLGVLAAMAALLGVAALIARPQTAEGFPSCSTLPHSLHVRLALFLLAIYGAMVLIAVLSAVVVQTSRGCASSPPPPPHATATVHSTTSSSTSSRPPLSSTSSTGGSRGRSLKTSASTASSASSSTVGLRAASSTADLLPSTGGSDTNGARPGVLRNSSTMSSAPPGGSDFRWCVCAGVAFLCCGFNHLPYLVSGCFVIAMGSCLKTGQQFIFVIIRKIKRIIYVCWIPYLLKIL